MTSLLDQALTRAGAGRCWVCNGPLAQRLCHLCLRSPVACTCDSDDRLLPKDGSCLPARQVCAICKSPSSLGLCTGGCGRLVCDKMPCSYTYGSITFGDGQPPRSEELSRLCTLCWPEGLALG